MDSLNSYPSRNLIRGSVFMLVVWIAATLAYWKAGWSFQDALYMVTLTVFTVGYGEVRPIDTTYLHVVTMATMAFGCTGMIFPDGFADPVHDAELAAAIIGRHGACRLKSTNSTITSSSAAMAASASSSPRR